ncbi:serine/threonine-protein kinase [Micromonospora sp. WMMD882]|uniref:serine/threonine-protein kinase n=1 Tax=Micromonospora sp. WMMD882 TaxID=3015151 RepID=UPI00248C0AC8|nr:serine/threonine-protein kinase [Micromonospora sp. WMMD882]WBB80863.1 serine/threonine-protein kinase [Micromonospora sp. WMMD882]
MLSSEVVLSGRYRLDERVATGGMGDVWRASDVVLGRQVAVKVLLPALVSDPDFIARFRAEARMMAALRHPGIVQVYDCGQDELDGGAKADYLVMEFVQGQPLSKRIEADGRLGVAETMSVVAQAAEALHAAHLGGIVHRDVKPSNLMVQESGAVVLVDFGVARSTNVTSITSTNAVPGTALYMAPEQAAGRPVSAATDIYALGAVAYCCLTGGPPFTGDNPLQVAVRHLDDEPPPLPDEIPEPVRALVSRALAKEPADRYASGAAMAGAARAAAGDALGTTAGGTPTVVVSGALRASGPDTRTDLPAVPAGAAPAPTGRPRRGTLIGAGAAVLVALTGLVAALGFTNDNAAPATNLKPTPSASVTSEVPQQVVPSDESDPDPTRPNRPGTSSSRPSADPTVTPSADPSVTPSAPAPTTGPTGAPTTTPPAAPPTTAPTTTPPAAPSEPPPPTDATGGGGSEGDEG